MMIQVICNKQHECKKTDKCKHAKPHAALGAGCEKPVGGVATMCHEGGMISICVPVVEGKYVENKIDWCKCSCGHQHRKDSQVEHEVPQ